MGVAPSRISDGSDLHIKDPAGLLHLGPFLLLLTKQECPPPLLPPRQADLG